MKATGIVRRIDDLGRIVIPKEIRRTLRIREGDPLEIFTDHEGRIVLKKYSPIGELGALARLYAESLSQSLGCTVCIADTDQIVAAEGAGKGELQGCMLGKEFLELLWERKIVDLKAGEKIYRKMHPAMQEFSFEMIVPILCLGDVIGAVVLLRKEDKKPFGNIEKQVASSAADFLGRQMQ